MVPDPKPEKLLRAPQRYRTIENGNPHRPERADRLEMETPSFGVVWRSGCWL